MITITQLIDYLNENEEACNLDSEFAQASSTWIKKHAFDCILAYNVAKEEQAYQNELLGQIGEYETDDNEKTVQGMFFAAMFLETPEGQKAAKEMLGLKDLEETKL